MVQSFEISLSDTRGRNWKRQKILEEEGEGSNLKGNTRDSRIRLKRLGEETRLDVGEGGAKRKKEDAETKIDKTSLWIPAACAAGRPHCSKCPARYEIMSVRIPRHRITYPVYTISPISPLLPNLALLATRILPSLLSPPRKVFNFERNNNRCQSVANFTNFAFC